MNRIKLLIYPVFYLFYWALNKIQMSSKVLLGWRLYKFKRQLKFVGSNVSFWNGVVIHGANEVSIGDNAGIGDYVVIWGGGGVEIGNNVLIAAHSVITSQGHDLKAQIFRLTQTMSRVVIRDNVWLGAGVLVMPGVEIGENTVIGAGSVVTKSIPPNSIAVGSPAIVIRKRND